jgi:hypothetical protein
VQTQSIELQRLTKQGLCEQRISLFRSCGWALRIDGLRRFGLSLEIGAISWRTCSASDLAIGPCWDPSWNHPQPRAIINSLTLRPRTILVSFTACARRKDGKQCHGLRSNQPCDRLTKRRELGFNSRLGKFDRLKEWPGFEHRHGALHLGWLQNHWPYFQWLTNRSFGRTVPISDSFSLSRNKKATRVLRRVAPNQPTRSSALSGRYTGQSLRRKRTCKRLNA